MATKPAAKTTAAKATKPGSNVVPIKSRSLVSVKEQMAAALAEQSGKTAPASGNAIRVTQDKHFLLPDGTKTQGPIDLVIVNFMTNHRFYEGAYDPKNISPPACFAIGPNPQAMVPSAKAPLPQASNCQECPNNAFGSAGEGKACKNSRNMAVLPPDATSDTPMWTLQTSPTANKGFDGLVKSVERVFQVPMAGVVVSVSFDPNETYAKLVFSDPRPNENVGLAFERMDEAKAMLATEPDVTGFVPMSKTPARKAAGARR